MAWKQSRTTRRLLAQDTVDDGKYCKICGRRIWMSKGALPVCNQPNCQRRFAQRYGLDED